MRAMDWASVCFTLAISCSRYRVICCFRKSARAKRSPGSCACGALFRRPWRSSRGRRSFISRASCLARRSQILPGIILYLTFWFPNRLRGRVMSFFVLAIAVSGIVGGPISGLIMQHLGGFLGFKSWQWLFLIEGMLPVMLGVAAFFVLDDRPRDARWLSVAEKDLLTAQSVDRKSTRKPFRLSSLRVGIAEADVVDSYLRLFLGHLGRMVLNFWAPTIIQRSGVSNMFHVGLLSAVPYAVGAIGMLAVCHHSDRMLERHWTFLRRRFLSGLRGASRGLCLLEFRALDHLSCRSGCRLFIRRRFVLDHSVRASFPNRSCRAASPLSAASARSGAWLLRRCSDTCLTGQEISRWGPASSRVS